MELPRDRLSDLCDEYDIGAMAVAYLGPSSPNTAKVRALVLSKFESLPHLPGTTGERHEELANKLMDTFTEWLKKEEIV